MEIRKYDLLFEICVENTAWTFPLYLDLELITKNPFQVGKIEIKFTNGC